MFRKNWLLLILLLLTLQTARAEIRIPDSIETLWELEDSRTEAVQPIVTALTDHGAPLGYDAESRTFYCTLGLETGTDWPEIFIESNRPDAELFWSDDYSYDFCDSAVSDGIAYEVFACTETEYEYFHIVFTGLPVICISTDAPMTQLHEDVSGRMSVSAAGETPVGSELRIHLRGSGYGFDTENKCAYRVEMVRTDSEGKEKKNKQSLLGMPADDDWYLLKDRENGIYNAVAWAMWRQWNSGQGFMMLESRFAEVFLNDRYMGLYQLTQHIDPEKELKTHGGDPETDLVYKVTPRVKDSTRQTVTYAHWNNPLSVELRYAPEGMENVFEPLKNFTADIREAPGAPDTLYSRRLSLLAEEELELDEFLNAWLFIQFTCNADSLCNRNNYWLWALRQDDGSFRLHISLWDLDLSFAGRVDGRFMYGGQGLLIQRLLDGDYGGSRRRLQELWEEAKLTVADENLLYEIVQPVVDEAVLSGAHRRDWERWNPGEACPALTARQFVDVCMERIDFLNKEIPGNWPVN